MIKDTFPTKLKELRDALKLTNVELAKRAGVPDTLISALLHSSKSVGENNANKIGTALGLDGDLLNAFIYLALNDAAGKVLVRHQDYPAEVLNLVAGALQSLGIAASDITHCDRKPQVTTLHLHDGRAAVINVEVKDR